VSRTKSCGNVQNKSKTLKRKCPERILSFSVKRKCPEQTRRNANGSVQNILFHEHWACINTEWSKRNAGVQNNLSAWAYGARCLVSRTNRERLKYEATEVWSTEKSKHGVRNDWSTEKNTECGVPGIRRRRISEKYGVGVWKERNTECFSEYGKSEVRNALISEYVTRKKRNT